MSLLQMSLTGAVMILVIAALRCLLLNRLPKQTFPALWWIVLARLLLPWTIPSDLSIYSIINRMEPVKAEAVRLPPILFTPALSPIDRPAPSPALPAPQPAPPDIWSVVWLAGAALCFLWFAAAYIRCRREFRTSLPVRNEYVYHWLQIHRLRRKIDIRQSAGIAAPLTYGVLRPVILLPKCTDWTDAEALRYVLEHEYIHIRRFDAASKLVFTAALCIHWFNPAVWLLYFLMNRDMELSCDDAVIRLFGRESRSKYAKTLIRMEETKSGLTPLANGFSKNAIEERIVAIMKTKKVTLLVSAVALVLVAATALLFATSAKAEKPTPTVEHAAVPLRETVPAGLLDKLTMDLTAGISRRKVSDTREELLRDDRVIGGLAVLDVDAETAYATDKLVKYLEDNIVEGLSSADYDYYMTSGGSQNGAIAIECGTRDRYFTHYIYRGSTALYDLWFEDPLTNTGEVQMMTASVQSDDIPEGKASPFRLSEVKTLRFDNFILDAWGAADLKDLWAAIHADMDAGAMVPEENRHQAVFRYNSPDISIFGAEESPYILLMLLTNGEGFSCQIYPECKNVMAWMNERGILQEMDVSCTDIGWGVAFEVLEADTDHLTIRCTQSGGTHLGPLQLEMGRVAPLIFMEHDGLISFTEEILIKDNDVTDFTVTWPESWEALPAGDYEFLFYLKDTGAADTDPLQRRGYKVAFTIAE